MGNGRGKKDVEAFKTYFQGSKQKNEVFRCEHRLYYIETCRPLNSEKLCQPYFLERVRKKENCISTKDKHDNVSVVALVPVYNGLNSRRIFKLSKIRFFLFFFHLMYIKLYIKQRTIKINIKSTVFIIYIQTIVNFVVIISCSQIRVTFREFRTLHLIYKG